jgi:hypothetical protein
MNQIGLIGTSHSYRLPEECPCERIRELHPIRLGFVEPSLAINLLYSSTPLTHRVDLAQS